jgi:hypothetical protein
VGETFRGVSTLLVFLAIAVLAFFGARHWQAAQSDYTRVEARDDCDLRAGACRRRIDGGAISLSVTPASIPLMKPLRIIADVEGLAVQGVLVEIRGLNMDMGLNRTSLEQTAEGRWEGETILPVCSQRRMEWEAAVRLDADRRVEVPFVFHTVQP